MIQRFPIFFLLVAMVSIQFGASLAKHLFADLGASGVTVFRTLFAAIFLCLLWRPWRTRWSKQELRTLLIYGACLGSMNLLFYFSLLTIPLGLAVAIEFTGPLALSLVTSRKWIDVCWVLLAAVGIVLILPHGPAEISRTQATAQGLNPLGVFFALSAGFFWALYIWFGKKASQHASGGQTTALGMAFAAITVLPFGIFQAAARFGEGSLSWTTIASAIPAGLGIALLSSAIPYSLEMNALKTIPMKTFGVLMSLEPVVAVLMGYLLLHELLTPLQWISIFCIVLASLGSNLANARSTAKLP